MKNMKKFAAMMAALTLSACSIAPMAMTASAASVSLTMTTPDNLPSGATIQENVAAYQVFTTEVTGSAAENSRLMNITGWGNGVNPSALLTAIKADDKFKVDGVNVFADIEIKKTEDDSFAKVGEALNKLTEDQLNAFAKAVINNKVGNGTAGKYASEKVTFDDIANGYYAISCTVKAATGDNHDAQSLGMLTVVDGDAKQVGNGKAKVGLPQVMKKVKEDVKTVTPYTGESLGVLETKVNLDNGVTTDSGWNDVADYDIGDTVPFKLYGTLPDDYDKYDTYYYCFNDTLGKEFIVPSKDDIVVKVDGTKITTGFSKTVTPATETDDNKIEIKFDNLKAGGLTVTKKSVITVEYSAVLSKAAEVGKPGQENAVNLTYSNNPNKQGTGKTGTTPDDKVKVYTYALEIEKTFFNAAGGPITVDELENGTYEQVVFNLSKDGSTLKFSKYDGEGDYDYVVDENGSAGLALTELDVNKDDGDGTDKTKKKDNKLVIRIKGLDDGTYTLKETTAPGGFNKASDQTITITAGTENDQTWDGTETDKTLNSFKWTVGTEEKKGSVDDALANTVVQNKKGSELPSTGGMGTTIFYLGGGAMVAVAGVFLITKKRMGKSEN